MSSKEPKAYPKKQSILDKYGTFICNGNNCSYWAILQYIPANSGGKFHIENKIIYRIYQSGTTNWFSVMKTIDDNKFIGFVPLQKDKQAIKIYLNLYNKYICLV